MKKIKIITAAMLVIMLAVAATYSIKANDSNARMETAIHNGSITDVFTCPMHPEVIMDKPGQCPKCGMDLVLNDVKKDASDVSTKECCKEHVGACSEQCMMKSDSKKDEKMMDKDEKMDHAKCGKKGSCCDK